MGGGGLLAAVTKEIFELWNKNHGRNASTAGWKTSLFKPVEDYFSFSQSPPGHQRWLSALIW